MKSIGIALTLVLSLSFLNACTGVGAAVGAGATVGVAAVSERGVTKAAQDVTIHAKIQERFFATDHTLSAAINIVVYEGRVLLTGSVETADKRATAVKLAWKISGVEEVINEIHVRNSGGILNFTHDTWITAQLKTALTFDDDIFAINYSIETSNQVVYLMGIAQNKQELDRVVAHARSIDYVKKVINYARVKTTTSPPTEKT